MTFKGPFTFDRDAARRWFTDGEALDGTDTVAYAEGLVDPDWADSDSNLDHAVRALSTLLADAPASVLASADGYDLTVDALADSEEFYFRVVVSVAPGLNLATDFDKSRKLFDSSYHTGDGWPGVERAIEAMAQAVAIANHIVETAVDLFGAPPAPRR